MTRVRAVTAVPLALTVLAVVLGAVAAARMPAGSGVALVLSLRGLCADLPRAPGGKPSEHSLALPGESYRTAIRAVGITLRGSMVA
jgi:hypothetical protein